MLFRHSASLVDAIRVDGSEAALRAIYAMPRAAPTVRDGELEISTSCGRRVACRGSWVTRDVVTRAIRVHAADLFEASYEPAV